MSWNFRIMKRKGEEEEEDLSLLEALEEAYPNINREALEKSKHGGCINRFGGKVS